MPVVHSDLIENTRVKLGRLNFQIEAVAGSEHPNKDSRNAVLELKNQVNKQLRKLENFNQYSPVIQASLLQQANYTIFALTDLLGFLIRATSTRNLFELYHPFLEISRKLVSSDVHLILSSDWKFSPFTYPFGLDELPNYILIGMPASESENILIFPTAAHELGHNIWKAQNIKDNFKSEIEQKTIAAFDANRPDFERIYGIKNADFQNDMFIQPIIINCINYLNRQIEETFCDFVGLLIFGKSYIMAFDYLIAPGGLGKRVFEYPSSKARVEALAHYGASIGVDAAGAASRFNEEVLSGPEFQTFPVRMADKARITILDHLFDYAKNYVHSRIGSCFSDKGCFAATGFFQCGVPTAQELTMGDLLNAAWDLYNSSAHKGLVAARGVELIPFLTDLVVKSAESAEYRSYLGRAKHSGS